ncbi:hypothetical protein ACR79N_15970 [Sphingobacterium siyangense]|uniref:hypothetical protein n=1 Tax=Sphingobacterium siyangense TaxID=459529 RepID=UPI003DA44000
MNRVLVLLLVLTTLFSCSKDDKLSGVDLSGSWVESGSTVTPPVIWKFDNGVLMKNTTKISEYKIFGNHITMTTPSKDESHRYESSFDNEILTLKGISNDFIFGSSLKSTYSFKRYVDK